MNRRRGQVAILMYHRVLSDQESAAGVLPGMYVRASTFARQVAWVKERWPIRTLGEVIAHPPDLDASPAVVLTFDDGWRDNLVHAWPVLRDHGVRATIFLVKEWVAAGSNSHGEFLGPKDVKMLATEGMEFGAHTATHAKLDRVDLGSAEVEMRSSKAAVEDWSGRPCELFAYPLGLHNLEAATLAGSIFRASVMAGGGWWSPGSDPALTPRINVHQNMSSTTSMFAATLALAERKPK
ncbi:MAG TPA: polysaccharide deacetylase family protein [Candidatus Polarisedimenticolaceae bacterium]|nr:polysaccharide deacetylase family protein [Candidatus Polarisedimenticolaceae bacterium]